MSESQPPIAEIAEAPLDFWDTRTCKFSKAEDAHALAFRAWLRDSQTPLGAYLADLKPSSPGEQFCRRDVRDLEDKIERKSPRHTNVMTRLKMLAKPIYHARRLYQAGIPLSTRAELLRTSLNPMVSGPNRVEARLEALLAAEQQWLGGVAAGPENCNSVPMSLVVLSAALHGGILNTDSAIALLKALANPIAHFACSARPYADLLLPWKGEPNQKLRRWYPDLITSCLITRVSNESISRIVSARGEADPSESLQEIDKKHIVRALWKEMDGNLRRYLKKDFRPDSLTSLFAVVETVMRSRLPSFVADDCAQRLDLRSLLPWSIGRVYAEPVNPDAAQGASLCRDPNQRAHTVEADYAEAYEGRIELEPPKCIDQIRKILAIEDKNTAKQVFANLAADSAIQDPCAKTLFQFAHYLLDHGSSYGGQLRPSSVRCCVLTVCRRLVPRLGGVDPATISSDLRSTYFLETMDEAAEISTSPIRMRRSVGWSLREFQFFLKDVRGATPIDDKIFQFPQGLLPITARIISLDDCARALELVDCDPELQESPRLREAAKAMILLGFFCGLRRMEALGLRVRDFRCGAMVSVLIDSWEGRTLKTENARRLFLLAGVVPEDLLQPAVAWRNAVASELSPDQPLFAGITDDVLIPIVHRALRAATGDQDVRFHDLRHSFATWTFLRLILSDLPEIPVLFRHLPRTSEWIGDSKTFRRAIYGNEMVSNDHAWRLADLMGHAHPDTSLHYYCHCTDMLIPILLRRNAAFGSIRETDLIHASGIPASTAYRHVSKFKKMRDETRADGVEVRESFARFVFARGLHLKRQKP